MAKYSLCFIIGVLLFSCGHHKENAKTSSNKHEQIFLELWEIFDANYAFFELRNVDWVKEKETQLSACGTIDSDSLLFENLCNLLKKFNDSHINLEDGRKVCNGGRLPEFYQEFPSNESFELFLKARNNTLQKVGILDVVDAPSKIFQYGIHPRLKIWNC